MPPATCGPFLAARPRTKAKLHRQLPLLELGLTRLLWRVLLILLTHTGRRAYVLSLISQHNLCPLTTTCDCLRCLCFLSRALRGCRTSRSRGAARPNSRSLDTSDRAMYKSQAADRSGTLTCTPATGKANNSTKKARKNKHSTRTLAQKLSKKLISFTCHPSTRIGYTLASEICRFSIGAAKKHCRMLATTTTYRFSALLRSANSFFRAYPS